MSPLETLDRQIAVTRTFTEDVWNEGDLDRISDIAADDLVCHGTSFGDLDGPDELEEFVRVARAAFPGLDYRVEDAAFDGDRVQLDWTAVTAAETSTRTAQTPISGWMTLRVSDGEITETWSSIDPWWGWG